MVIVIDGGGGGSGNKPPSSPGRKSLIINNNITPISTATSTISVFLTIVTKYSPAQNNTSSIGGLGVDNGCGY